MKLFLLFAILILATSCGKLNKYFDSQTYDPYYYITYESLDDYSQSFRVSCNDSANCSDYTGTLLTQATPRIIGSCTAFLISSNKIMTNSHCIPNHLKLFNPSACSDSILFLLPANNKYAARKIKCDHVLFNSKPFAVNDDFTFNADYAIIQLQEHVDRPVPTISNQGLALGENYFIYKSDNDLYSRVSNIKKIECSIKDNSIPTEEDLNFQALKLSKNRVNALDCTTIKGNSGSPVVSSNDDITFGILYGGGSSGLGFVSYITNFQCLEVRPISSYLRHSTCN